MKALTHLINHNQLRSLLRNKKKVNRTEILAILSIMIIFLLIGKNYINAYEKRTMLLEE
jgi:hypothetical protein